MTKTQIDKQKEQLKEEEKQYKEEITKKVAELDKLFKKFGEKGILEELEDKSLKDIRELTDKYYKADIGISGSELVTYFKLREELKDD